MPFVSNPNLQITIVDNGWIVNFFEALPPQARAKDSSDDDEDEWDEPFMDQGLYHGLTQPSMSDFAAPLRIPKSFVFTKKEELLKFVSDRI